MNKWETSWQGLSGSWLCIVYELFNISVRTLCCFITFQAAGESFFSVVTFNRNDYYYYQGSTTEWTEPSAFVVFLCSFVFRFPFARALNIASIWNPGKTQTENHCQTDVSWTEHWTLNQNLILFEIWNELNNKVSPKMMWNDDM